MNECNLTALNEKVMALALEIHLRFKASGGFYHAEEYDTVQEALTKVQSLITELQALIEVIVSCGVT